jgi:oligopeptide/dipeptide ABC transporter ATP-binding protein
MYAGKIVEAAVADEVFGDPRHPYTLGLLNSIPRMDRPVGARLVPIEGMPPDLIDDNPGCPFAPRCTFRVDRCAAQSPDLAVVPGSNGVPHRAACWVDVRTAGRTEASA